MSERADGGEGFSNADGSASFATVPVSDLIVLAHSHDHSSEQPGPQTRVRDFHRNVNLFRRFRGSRLIRATREREHPVIQLFQRGNGSACETTRVPPAP